MASQTYTLPYSYMVSDIGMIYHHDHQVRIQSLWLQQVTLQCKSYRKECLDPARLEEHYKESNANPRNLVAGLVNKKKPTKEELKYLEFVVYEIIEPVMKPSEQLTMLEQTSHHLQFFLDASFL